MVLGEAPIGNLIHAFEIQGSELHLAGKVLIALESFHRAFPNTHTHTHFIVLKQKKNWSWSFLFAGQDTPISRSLEEVRKEAGEIVRGSEKRHTGEEGLFSCGGHSRVSDRSQSQSNDWGKLWAGWTSVFQTCSVESWGFREGAQSGAAGRH